ncbi:hypothetical protein [Candidatus Thiodictyon syntrophicum]|jgi:hypothetical protein|uniref:hypothetical protein n=1 Tax=Candidatus Thiodictyon syntrophicum TaxID=1166950 RepID=UPI0012FD3573|nr:hypothetical protein [Candidatus Thiodictyon syntrophicum]
MNRVFLVAVLLAAYGSGAFAAPCPGTQLSFAQITAALQGKTINANSPAGENWNEIHCGTSGSTDNLQKVGLGVGHPVDPQEKVGTWTVNVGATGVDTVTYNYGPGAIYTWRVFSTDTTIDSTLNNICWQAGGEAIATQTAAATQVGCLP